MNRRGFFKAVSAVLAAMALPVRALALPAATALPVRALALPAAPVRTYSWFDPACQYGDYVSYSAWSSAEAVAHLVRDMARAVLPPGTLCELINVRPHPHRADPLAQRGAMAWKHTPGLQPGENVFIV